MAWTIGKVKVSLVREHLQASPLELMYTNADRAVLEANLDWIAPYLHADGRLLFSVHSLVLDTGSLVILVDACNGTHRSPEENYAIDYVDWIAELGKAGYAPADIDVVLCTHLHDDHIGWNTHKVDGEWVPTFPNARYLMSGVEFAYTQTEEAQSTAMGFSPRSSFDTALAPLVAAGQADLIEMSHRICDEVTVAPAPGHSPGHVMLRIESEGARAVITGDAVHHPVQFAAPRWRMFLDWDPDLAVRTREALMEEIADRDTQVFGAHFVRSSTGFVTRAGEGSYRYRDAGD